MPNNFKGKITDQRLSRSKTSGDPLLTLTVDIIGEYRDKYDTSFGVKPVDAPQKQRVYLDFGAMKLPKTLEYFAAMGVKDVTVAKLSPSAKDHISLVGKDVTLWVTVNEESKKETWRISKTGPVTFNNSKPDYTDEELKEYDRNVADILQAAGIGKEASPF